MVKPSEGKLLYHITSISNMESIIQYGLLSRAAVNHMQIGFQDIADQEIIEKRADVADNLSNYVLFHFYPKNPFDYAVCHNYGSQNMAIIAIKRPLTPEKKDDFSIIPSHPLGREAPEIYCYDEGFSRIDWPILDDCGSRDYADQETKNACMAECITRNIITIDDIAYIYVSEEETKRELFNMQNSDRITGKVQVNKWMFP